MKLYAVVFMTVLAFALGACQSTAPRSSARAPAATGSPEWRELLVDEPSTFLNVRETQTRIAVLNGKIQTLEDCGMDERGWSESLLELDLLFIRAQDWPADRFEKEYGRRLSPQQMRCLQERASAPGV